MARFEVNIVYAKMEEDGVSTYTEEYDYICFCDEEKSVINIKEKISEMIEDEIANSEDEVLFGLATAVIDPTSTIIVDFKNKDHKNVEELIDFILEGERTLH
jgi:hypothetical protein